MTFSPFATRRLTTAVAILALSLLSAPVVQAGGVTYTDIAAGGGAGLAYERQPSASIAVFDFFTQQPILTIADWPFTPAKPHGAPGVVIFDYDGDDDLDLYVTSGPGTANSLFENWLVPAAQTVFDNVASAAGVDATAQDSSGACAGDIDNDGDPDLLVLSNFGPNRLYENLGPGAGGQVSFADISASSGLGADVRSSVSCSFGDVDNDGLLDVVVANTFLDMSNSLGIVVPFAFNQHNQLYRNLGGNVFANVSTAAGIENTTGFFPPVFDGSPTLTWAIAFVDADLDGDVDLIYADDQAGVPFARDGGVDRGLIHLFRNDGTGFFTDVTGTDSPASPGAWMGLSFGDLDADGRLDLFASNLGDYASTTLTPLDPVYADFANYFLGDLSSRWYLGGPGGTLTDPGLGPLVATPFGWGTSMADYDNDGDTDVIYHGGLYFGPVGQGAPGAILENDGSGVLSRDATALAGSTDHEARTVQGMAMGDLDRDGFVDIVSVSNFDIPPAAQSIYNHNWGSGFDGGRYTQIFAPTGDLTANAVWSGIALEKGTLSVELASGNGNGSARVKTLGTVGLTSGGGVNRDGIGAVVEFRTASGKTVLRPVLGGSSYASQDALEGVFGLGGESRGQVEVLWPGGVRNRLYDVRPGESVVFPEIPCSFDGDWENPGQYTRCVQQALGELQQAGVLDPTDRGRFFTSAIRAFRNP